jgi:hypothetical protein
VQLTVKVELPPRDREVLASWVRATSIRAGLAQRARIVLLAADGAGTSEIVARTGASKPTVIAWKKHHPPGHPPRHVHLGQGPDQRDRGVHRRLERPLPALHLDQDRR